MHCKDRIILAADDLYYAICEAVAAEHMVLPKKVKAAMRSLAKATRK